MEIDIRYANTPEEAEDFVRKGYEPVECSFGDKSVVGDLQLDHHGNLSHLEPVSISAARLAIEGIRKNKFVVTGRPDCDQIYAIAVLGGKIPANLEAATAIAEIDMDPIGRDMTLDKYLPNLAFDQRTLNLEKNSRGTTQALEELIRIYSKELSSEEKTQAITAERDRRRRIKSNINQVETGLVAFVISDEKGFNEWYQEAPIIVQYNPSRKSITLALCPKKGGLLTDKTGFDILGEEGLKPVYKYLDAKTGISGYGGREVVGGSPRGIEISESKALEIYEKIKEYISIRQSI